MITSDRSFLRVSSIKQSALKPTTRMIECIRFSLLLLLLSLREGLSAGERRIVHKSEITHITDFVNKSISILSYENNVKRYTASEIIKHSVEFLQWIPPALLRNVKNTSINISVGMSFADMIPVTNITPILHISSNIVSKQ